MRILDINNSPHDWEKQNLMTIPDKNGSYDLMLCKSCGIKGKRRNFTQIEVKETYSAKKTLKCIEKRLTEGRVRVINCTAVGYIFSNLTPKSEHDIIPVPKGESDNLPGIWVQGVGHPIKLLKGEYEVIEND